MQKNNFGKWLALTALGVAVSVLPPMLAVLAYFPAWVAEGGEHVFSGFTAFLLIVAALPIYRTMKKLLASPSAWVMWLVAFLAFLLLSNIAEEMTVISFVGLISNIAGAIAFKLSKRYKDSDGETA